MINQSINKLIEDYIKIFELYGKYQVNNDDKEIANPLQHEVYLFLVNFFTTDQIKNETNIDILFKVINLINVLNNSLEQFDKVNIEKNKIYLNGLIDKSVDIIINNVMSATKFEEEIKKTVTHEQTTALLEHLLEKIQLNLMNQNFIKNYGIKEEIKLKIKQKVLQIYQLALTESGKMNLGGLTEEELTNSLDII